MIGWNHDKGTTARGYGWRWQQLRKVILSRDMYLCQPCRETGRVTAATQVDHIKAKAKGGSDEPANLRAICDACHQAKTLEDSGRRKPKQAIGVDGWPTG